MTGNYTLTVLADVETKERDDTRWLWPDYIPAGMMGMLDGDGGLGKSYVTIDLATRVTRGLPWPDGTKGGRPADVLILAAEDSRNEIAKRLKAAGADLRRVSLLEEVNPGRRMPRIPDDIPILEGIIRDRKVKLVIIDPIMAYLTVTATQDQKVREAMTPLKRLAEKSGATILFIRHLNKSTGRNAKMAGGGSVGLLAACRFGYLFAEKPDNPEARVMAPIKFNIGKPPASLEFSLADKDGKTVVKWENEPVEWRADDLLRARAVNKQDRQERDEVVAFLDDYFKENGLAVWAKDLFKDGSNAGMTQKMLRTAKFKLGARSRKVGPFWCWVHPDWDRPISAAKPAGVPRGATKKNPGGLRAV